MRPWRVAAAGVAATAALATVGLLGVGRPAGAVTDPVTDAASSTTGVTSTTVDGSVQITGVPCVATGSGPCTADPSTLVALFPATTTVAALDVKWDGAARPASAPAPSSTDAYLTASAAGTCPSVAPSGDAELCWPWPSALLDPARSTGWLLNGTYRATACSSAVAPCTAAAPSSTVSVAAAPAAARDVRTSLSGAVVTVSWSPSAAPEPDLAGYRVLRGGTAVYTCSLAGLGPEPTRRCPADLTATDDPGNGTWSYTVEALRLGPSASATDAVASIASVASQVTVISASSGPRLPPNPVVTLGPVPVVGVVPGRVSGGGSVPTGGTSGGGGGQVAASAGPAASGPGTTLAEPGGLDYASGDEPAVGEAGTAAAARETGSRPDVGPAAAGGLGLLLLALAAHLLYIRAELDAAAGRSRPRHLHSRRRRPASD